MFRLGELEPPKEEMKRPAPAISIETGSPQIIISPDFISSPNEHQASSEAKSKSPEKMEESKSKKANAGGQLPEESKNKRKKNIRERFGLPRGPGENPPKSNEKAASGTPPTGHSNDVLEHPKDGMISMLAINEYVPQPGQGEIGERSIRKNSDEHPENKGTLHNKICLRIPGRARP